MIASTMPLEIRLMKFRHPSASFASHRQSVSEHPDSLSVCDNSLTMAIVCGFSSSEIATPINPVERVLSTCAAKFGLYPSSLIAG